MCTVLSLCILSVFSHFRDYNTQFPKYSIGMSSEFRLNILCLFRCFILFFFVTGNYSVRCRIMWNGAKYGTGLAVSFCCDGCSLVFILHFFLLFASYWPYFWVEKNKYLLHFICFVCHKNRIVIVSVMILVLSNQRRIRRLNQKVNFLFVYVFLRWF